MATPADLQAAIEELQRALLTKPGTAKLEKALKKSKESWTEKLRERMGSIPWWMISTMIQGCLLLLPGFFGLTISSEKVPAAITSLCPLRPGSGEKHAPAIALGPCHRTTPQ